jgi:ABC-type branched-subunit amino acid transport system substrate-binding protein
MPIPSRNSFKFIAVFLAGALIGAFAAIEVADRSTTTRVAEGRPGAARTNDGTTTGVPLPTASGTATLPGANKALQPPPGLACAPGRNGGKTDVGVTAKSIKLATTTVQSGIGEAFLGDVKYAMEAVKNKVNRGGGICGRLLEIKYVDDAWRADTGSDNIRNFIHEGYFAMPVGPSSEGLNAVIKSGDIKSAGFPVVGTDGMVILQYRDPWVWSVATATVSTARIMAQDAWRRGARNLSIVFDKDYKFGEEAAAAYNAEFRRLKGSNIAGCSSSGCNDDTCTKSFCGIQAGKSDYGGEVANFEPGDFVAMFLEPTTALAWMKTVGAPTPAQVPKGIGAAQPLFTFDFGKGCQQACDQMQVWTAYKPRREEYATDPAVREFQSDLYRTNNRADEFNAFAEGGYVGMQLLEAALRRVGPFLTRARLRAVLDSMSFQSGLTVQGALRWSPKNRFANTTMQAWTMQYKGTFSGWTSGPIVADKHPEYGTN